MIDLQAEPGTKTEMEAKIETKINIGEFVFAFMFPTALGKALVIYFGVNYSNDRGPIYGWGLFFSILFTICMVARFLWKYRNYQD